MKNNFKKWFNLVEPDEKPLHTNSDFVNIIEEVIEYNGLIREIKSGEKYYRARTIENLSDLERNKPFWGYDKKGSHVPPKHMINNEGRLNYNNHQVLYMATDPYTALSEIRPEKRQHISISELKLVDDIKVVEFDFHNSTNTETAYHWICLEFYKCINNSKYRITQQIGECIESLGYDGIIYSSSLSETGENIALFDSDRAEPVNSKLYQTKSVLYIAEEHLPRTLEGNSKENHEYRLLPKSITSIFDVEKIEMFFDKIKNSKSGD